LKKWNQQHMAETAYKSGFRVYCYVTGSMAPNRQSEMAKIVLRALVAGIFVSILNACLAGELELL